MVNFYYVGVNSDENIVGVLNSAACQTEITVDSFKDKGHYDYVLKYLGSNHFWEKKTDTKDLNIRIENLNIFHTAKLTDFLRFYPALRNTPYIVSERVKKVIQQHLCRNVIFWDTQVTYEEAKYSYSLMYIEPVDVLDIEYNESVFYTGNIVTKEEIVFSSFEEKKQLVKKYPLLIPKEIKLKNQIVVNDIYKIGGAFYISENLFNDLNKISATGVRYLPAFGENNNHSAILKI